MKIQTAVYIDESNKILLVNGVMFVPVDEGNRHYGMVLEWELEGNKRSPYVAPVPSNDEVLQALKDEAMQEELDVLIENGTGAKVQAYKAEKARQG